MDGLVVLLALAVVFFLKILARNRTSAVSVEQLHYLRRPALFTPAERSFASVLNLVLNASYRVYEKFRLADHSYQVKFSFFMIKFTCNTKKELDV